MNLGLLFLVAAAVCFVVCLLLALSVFSGGNFDAWLSGGLLAYILSLLSGALPQRTA